MYFDVKCICNVKNVALWLKYIKQEQLSNFLYMVEVQIHELHIECTDIYIWICMYVQCVSVWLLEKFVVLVKWSHKFAVCTSES